MNKSVLPVAVATLPTRLKSAFKLGFVTRSTHNAAGPMNEIAPPPPMKARAICNNCSLPSPTRRGRCSYCGTLLLTAGLWWPSGLLSMRSILAMSLLIIAGWGLLDQASRLTSLLEHNTLSAKPTVKSLKPSKSKDMQSHWSILPTLPVMPSMGQPSAQVSLKPASTMPTVPLVQMPAMPTDIQRPVDAHAQGVPTPPLTCGGFPAAGQTEPDFTPYLAQVQDKIRAHWQPPTVDQPKHVVVLYRIACDGRLEQAGLKVSSGIPVADQAALAAVRAAAPFPALPKTYAGRHVDVEFDFDYEMAASRKSHTPPKK